MLYVLFVLLGLIVGVAIGALVGRRTALRLGGASERAAETEARQLVEAARTEAEGLKKEGELKAKELAYRLKAEVEDDVRKRKAEIAKKEEAVAVREEQAEKRARDAGRREEDLQRREKQVAQKEQAAADAEKKAEELLAGARERLEKIAGLSAEEAKKALSDQMAEEARRTAATEVRKIETAAHEEAAEKAKKIIGTAIQRYASEFVAERTVAVVPLPSDDLKGRLIGREGRNVRALEAATGTDLIIDDTPESITISCFNPIRREIARSAIGRLVADGRIHPTRIEEVVHKAEKEIDGVCVQAGEQAVFDLGLHRVHPELVKMLGGLKFRQSHAQNVLQHSIEVGFLAGIMAAELGLNVKQARRAGLLHDIGKAVDHEQEGPHATVGAQVAKRLGEAPRICQAIAAHHEDVPQTDVLDHIVDAANRLSSQRPGARRETLQSYVKRLEDLERLAKGFAGVEKAFAIMAGREVRVVVENSITSDDQALLLSKDIARKIEQEMSYPGQVRVCVLRETRATDYAK